VRKGAGFTICLARKCLPVSVNHEFSVPESKNVEGCFEQGGRGSRGALYSVSQLPRSLGSTRIGKKPQEAEPYLSLILVHTEVAKLSLGIQDR